MSTSAIGKEPSQGKSMNSIKVVLYGIGEVGSRIGRHLLEKEGVQIVGAIDIDKEKVGKDLGEVLKINRKLGIIVSNNASEVVSKTKPHVVIHATTSYLQDVYPQLLRVIEHGANVISTCEELAYPYIVNKELAERLDKLARAKNVTVLGTGINPGFLMDTLVITLTAVCQKIERIKVRRVMNASKRRVPFQKKIGAGLSPEEFKEKIQNKVITGHVGLEQSIALIADALAWELDEIKVEPVKPVIAEHPVESDAIKVEAGMVAGLKQTAHGIKDYEPLITLEFLAYIGAEEEYDSIQIEGIPPVNQKISPCIHGDYGTVAIIVNSIPKVINAPSGLLTMKDLPVPSATPENMTKYVRQKI